jgi:DNA-binding GntR family transcriptional regulator
LLTLVLDRSEAPRFFSAIRSVGELLQFVGATEMQVLAREEVRADADLAAQLRCEPGQRWVEFRILRHVPGQKEPLNYLQAFLPPELAGAIGRRRVLRQPIYSLVEARHGLRVADVLQEITAASLPATMARALHVPAGHAAIRISRFYSDARGRMLAIGIGHYPAGRYVQRTRFRAHAAEDGRGRR